MEYAIYTQEPNNWLGIFLDNHRHNVLWGFTETREDAEYHAQVLLERGDLPVILERTK